jgi:hypothetical protein
MFNKDERLRSASDDELLILGSIGWASTSYTSTLSTCSEGGLGAVRTGSKADLAASSPSKTMTFNVPPAMSVIQKPETIPGACRARGRTFASTYCPLVLI